MKKPIDIIIPFVNNQDAVWQTEFNKHAKANGLKGQERFRDMYMFNYVFRSIEKNCPWCRYVFLVLSGESQIPDWLNVYHPKLKIIFHREYIPSEFLPTFNSNVIEMFYSNIDELSDNFIIMNDDFFFTKNISENYFFEDGEPKVHRKIQNAGLWKCSPSGDKCFVDTINNNSRFISEMFKTSLVTYKHFHMPFPMSKSLQQFIWFKYHDELYTSLSNSQFRQSKNYTQWLFEDIQKVLSKYKDANLYSNSHVFNMGDTTFNIKQYNMICFNDKHAFSIKSAKAFLAAIDTLFPNASSFEY